MKKFYVGVAGVTAAALSLLTSAANAATATQSPAPPTGPALTGVCVLSNDRVVYGSVVGKYVIGRMEQLKAQADAELNSEGSTIENDAKALEGQRATLPADQYQQRGGLINQRAQLLQRKAQQRQRELSATQEKALARIGVEVDPVVRQVFAQRSCSLLFNGAALVYPAPTMDVTESVIHGLDAKIQQFPIDREHLDQSASQSGN